jgi:hypothetical protein
MGHHWVMSLLLLYNVFGIHAGAAGLFEVCAFFPRPPTAPLLILFVMVGVICLHGFGKWLLSPTQKEPPLRGGFKMAKSFLGLPSPVWIGFGGALFITTFMYLSLTGPLIHVRFNGLDDVNDRLSRAVNAINMMLPKKLPESAGDCDALWEHRARIVNTSNALSIPRDRCVGSEPLANKSVGGVGFAARWLTGIDTIKVTHILILPPKSVIGIQNWRLRLSGQFGDLHVWLKVWLDNKQLSELVQPLIEPVWIDDNMCCTNPFHFTIELSAVCSPGKGFNSMRLDIPHFDAIDLKHTVNDTQGSYHTDYGSFEVLQEALRKMFTMKAAQVQVQTQDGYIDNPMLNLSSAIDKIVVMNAGHHCPTGEMWIQKYGP